MSSTILRRHGRLRPVALALALALALAFGGAPAAAHEIPARVTVRAFLRVEPGRLHVLVRAPLEAMRDVDFPQRGLGYLDLSRSSAMARESALLWIAGSLTVYEDGRALPPPELVATRISLPSDRAFARYESALATLSGAPLDSLTDVPWNQAALDVHLVYPLHSADAAIAVESKLARLGLQTTTVLRFIAPDGAERAYQFTGDPGRIHLDPRWHHAAFRFLALGVQHILGGIDHLLFVLCLVIPFRRFRPLVLIVTAFTVAHSITLASAALGVVPDALWFPPLVETVIAASIVYMALENIVGARVQRRWLVAFGFGLVHGFGFSFALSESLQFAGAHLATSLLAFNLGVEIGQVLVLAAAVPVLGWLLERPGLERVGVIVLSAFIAHTAWHWTTERGATLGDYSFAMPALDLSFAASAMRAAIVMLIAGGAAWALAELYRRLLKPPPEMPALATDPSPSPITPRS
jgi:hypothetical protein